MSGKGSKPRPLSIPIDEFNDRWDSIFKKKSWDHYSDLPSTESYANDYQDILSTEDCVEDVLKNFNSQGEQNGC